MKKISADGVPRKHAQLDIEYTYPQIFKISNARVARRVAKELMRQSDPRLTAYTYTDVTALPLFNEIEKLQRILPSPIASLKSDHGGVNLSTAGQPAHAEIAPAVAEVVQIVGICPELSAVGQDWAKADGGEGGIRTPGTV